MESHKPSWLAAQSILANDRSGDLIALVFALILAIGTIALLPLY